MQWMCKVVNNSNKCSNMFFGRSTTHVIPLGKNGIWVPDRPGIRARGSHGRVYTVYVTYMRCYCLRKLRSKKRANSFTYLKKLMLIYVKRIKKHAKLWE